MKITYGVLDPERFPDLLGLYQSLYPDLGWTENYLKWQYSDNPAGRAQVWAARCGDKIISTYAAIPHWIYSRGEVVKGWRIQDVMTLPEYRGQGIYHQISAAAAEALNNEDHPVNFTFPNEKSHNAFLRTGWSPVFRLPLWERRDAAGLAPRAVAVKVRQIQEFDAEAEEIWRLHRRAIESGIERTAVYLNWRYMRNPKAKYSSFLLEHGGDRLVVVLKTFVRADGSRWSHLCDLFQTSPNQELTDSAFNQWVHFSLEGGCGAMSCWSAPGSSLSRSLERAGFSSDPTYNRWLLSNAKSVDPNRRHLFMGDSDVF